MIFGLQAWRGKEISRGIDPSFVRPGIKDFLVARYLFFLIDPKPATSTSVPSNII